MREGVKTFEFLLANNELESATKRLAEAFTIGEFVPEIRTLTRDKKRRALRSPLQKAESTARDRCRPKDYAKEPRKSCSPTSSVSAKDFDGSQAQGADRNFPAWRSKLHLASARNAAPLRGDEKTLEEKRSPRP